jgi:hypothetical protein
VNAPRPCAYCGRQLALRESHVLPRWIIERALAKSPTGRMRDADRINRPVQDGEKLPLLCSDCEERFGALESPQAQKHDNGTATPGAPYDADFSKFVVSILWRVGISRLEQLRTDYAQFVSALNSAIQTWKDFLDGNRPDVGNHAAYFLFLDEETASKVFIYREEGFPNEGPAPVLHRYLLNSINTQLVVYAQDGYALAWTMGNAWLMVGVIEVPPDERIATAIDLSPDGGIFPSGQFNVPPIILATLRRQSLIYLQEKRQISPRQRDRMRELASRRAAHFTDQSQRLAKEADVAMFGDAANIDLADQADGD